MKFINIPIYHGTGTADSFIEYMHALANKLIQHYTCFISYSSKNHDFAQRLHADLQANNVRCGIVNLVTQLNDMLK